MSAASASPRRGSRGAIIVSRSGSRSARRRCASSTSASSPGWVLAASHTGRSPIAAARPASASGSAGKGGAAYFRLPAVVACAGAERREPRPIGLALGQAEREAAAKLRSACRQPLPAPERALRDAPVDQRERQVPRARLEDQVRPQLGFDQHAELRAPVREERAPGLRPVDRRELMPRARRQLSGHQRRRSHRAGGHQHLQGGALRQQRLDQGQERAGFADACGMQPQQRPLRTRHARGAEALAPTQGILLAAPRPPPQLRLDQGPAQRGGAAIQLQQHQATDTSSRSRSGSPTPWPANCCRYSRA